MFDLAFQKYIVKNYPEYKIESHLMLADKSKVSIDGLNQLFQITKDPNVRTGIMRKVDTLSYGIQLWNQEILVI